MSRARFRSVFAQINVVLGMVHLHPLPGAPRYGGRLAPVVEAALRDAEAIRRGGASGMIVENFNDNPFYPDQVEPETVAAMAVIAKEVVHAAGDLPVGINVLRNDWKAALAIALAVGGRFIRLNILTDALVTDQGLIEAPAHLALRYRRALGADHLLILADVYCKHGAPLARRPLGTVARDTAERGLADALIVSGEESGDPPRHEDILEVRAAVPDVPVLLGSGMRETTAETVALVDGSIFGYHAKVDDIITNPVDPDRVRRFVAAVARSSSSATRGPGAAERSRLNPS
jgi:membrane complex biogenesis BtpA family protein